MLMARNDEKQHKVYHTCSTIRSDANGDDHKTRLQRGYVTKCVCWSNMAGLDLQGGGYRTTCDCLRVCYDRQIARQIDCGQTMSICWSAVM